MTFSIFVLLATLLKKCNVIMTPGGGGGGTLIFSYIRRLGPFFFWFKTLCFNIFFGFLEKRIFLGGIKILWIFFGGSSQNWASLRVISMQFRVFFKAKVQNWDIFLGC